MVGIIDAPGRPCSARNRIMLSMFQARPHSRLAAVNPPARTGRHPGAIGA